MDPITSDGNNNNVEQTKNEINTGGGTNVTGDVNIQNGDFVGRDKIVQPRKTPPTGSAPPLPQPFIGREDTLQDIKTRLGILPGGQPPGFPQTLTIVVRGWPGVGKTAIVSALAHDTDVLAAFPDGILWTSLGPKPSLHAQLVKWGQALGTDGEAVTKAKTWEEASKRLTALLLNKRMLLIVDDVWEPQHARPFKVGGHACATLITTRIPNVADTLAPTATSIYWLPVLADEKALVFLQELAPTVVAQYPEESRKLVHALKGLPISLRVAGHLLREEARYGFRFGISDLLAELHQANTLLASPISTELANETTLAALLHKSIELLDKQTYYCFACLGIFAPDPATFDLETMKAVWKGKNPKSIVRGLMNRGLFENIAEDRYQMHALLHAYAQTLLERKEAKKASQKHFIYLYDFVQSYTSIDPNKHDDRERFDLLYPQMEQVFVNFENGHIIVNSKAKDEQLLKLADFAQHLGRVLSLQSRLDEALEWVERCQTVLGEAKSQEANTIRAVMHINYALIRYQQDSLDAAEKECTHGISLGDPLSDNRNQLRSYAEGYNLLGAIHLRNGKLAPALEAFEKSLSLWEQVGDQYLIACANENISTIHYNQGHFALARDAGERHLVYLKKFPDRIELAMALTNLGLVYQCLGSYQRAFDLHREAIETSDRIGIPRIQALARNNIAGPCIALAKHAEAETYLNQSVQIQTEHKIKEYQVATQCYLAELAYSRQLYRDAIELAEKAMELAQQGGDPFDEGEALRGLGQAWYAIGESERAREYLETSRSQLRENEYKYENYLTSQVLEKVYIDLGDAEKARATADEVRTLAIEMGLRPPEA